MRTVAERIGDKPGYIVGDQSTWNIRYEDDTLLITTPKTELTMQADELQRESLKIDLKVNADKTQAMVINKNSGQFINVNGEESSSSI